MILEFSRKRGEVLFSLKQVFPSLFRRLLQSLSQFNSVSLTDAEKRRKEEKEKEEEGKEGGRFGLEFTYNFILCYFVF